MTVTRDVVIDLLPGYFAGDLSADSRGLVDAHLATDPEFARMAERFGRLLDRAAPPAAEAARQQTETLARARRAQQRRGEFRGLAIGYGMAALLLLGGGLWRLVDADRAYVIGATFGAVALLCIGGWLLAERRPEWFANEKYWGA